MWKVVTSSNLNLPLKLFFYSPILANNNMLLKIYCENIVVAFLNCHFLFFILFFISFIHMFLSFFFLSFFLHQTRIPLLPPSSPFFFYFFFFFSQIPKPLSFSFLNSLFFYFLFLFSLDSRTFSSSLRDKKQRKRQREKEQVRVLVCSTVDRRTQAGEESVFTMPSCAFCSAAVHLPPQHNLDGSDDLCLFCFYYYD